jgi:hypothetical protein
MNKSWFYLGAIGSLAILMTSCGGDSGKPAAPAATAPAATPAPAPAAPAAAVPATPATPTATTTTKPATTAASPTDLTKTAAGIKPVSVDVAAGLIPPTNADNWAKTVSKGRSDPFAALALDINGGSEPKSSIGNTSVSSSGSKSLSSSGTTSGGVKSGVNKSLPKIKIAAIPTNLTPDVGNPAMSPASPTSGFRNNYRNPYSSPASRSGVNRNLPKVTIAFKPDRSKLVTATPGQTATIRRLSPNSNATIAFKPLPQPLKAVSNGSGTLPTSAEPTLARTIGISGVMQVEGKTQVIVKLPNESFSRYVEVGDRIYDGKIKIKRIEGEDTLSPIVVLEEVGVEVNRRVGDTADTIAK